MATAVQITPLQPRANTRQGIPYRTVEVNLSPQQKQLAHKLAVEVAHQTIPAPKLQSCVTYDDGDTNAIIREVVNVYNESNGDMCRFAEVFGKHVKQQNWPAQKVAYAIWALVRHNVAYKIDPPGQQFVKTPSRTWFDGYADCKGYSILIASALSQLGLPCGFRFVSYKPGPYTHVYVVTTINNQTIPLDACLPAFGSEKPYLQKKDIMTQISRLSGVREPLLIDHLDNEDALELAVTRAALTRLRNEANANNNVERAIKIQNRLDYVNDAINAAISGNEDELGAVLTLKRMGEYDVNPQTVQKFGRQNVRTRQRRLISKLMQLLRLGRKQHRTHALPIHSRFVNRYKNANVRRAVSDYISGLEDYEQIGSRFTRWAKNVAKGASQVVKKVSKGTGNVVRKGFETVKRFNPLSVVARNSYLLLLRVNFRGMASKLARGRQNQPDVFEKFAKKWEKIGGKRDALIKAIEAGKGKKPVFGGSAAIKGVIADINSIAQTANNSIGSTSGIGKAVTLGTALASAGTLLALFKPIMALFKGKSGEEEKEESSESATLPGEKEGESALKNSEATEPNKMSGGGMLGQISSALKTPRGMLIAGALILGGGILGYHMLSPKKGKGRKK